MQKLNQLKIFVSRAVTLLCVCAVFAAALALLIYSWRGVVSGWSNQSNNAVAAVVKTPERVESSEAIETTRLGVPEFVRSGSPEASIYRNGRDRAAGIEFPVFPVRGTITDRFGFRGNPFGFGITEFHRGLDIGAAHGTPVIAAAKGVVQFADWEGGYGNVVMIEHDRGKVVTRYAHLSQFAVVANQPVAAGTVVGYVGSTGRSTGPHLHFEVRIDGSPIDPLAFYSLKRTR